MAVEAGKSGLVKVRSYSLAYTSGGTYEVAPGDVIVGASSGASAMVADAGLSSGTWAGGDAAGTFVLVNQVGTFELEDLNVLSNSNVATIGADSSPVDTTVAELTNWTIDSSLSVVDTTQLTDDWATHAVEGRNWSGSTDCHWDATDSLGQELIDLTSDELPVVTLLFYPEGADGGDSYYYGLCSLTGNSSAGARGSSASRKFSFTGETALLKGSV